MKKNKLLLVFLIAGLASLGAASDGEPGQKAAERRAKIDAVAEETLERLFDEAPHAKKLYKTAYGLQLCPCCRSRAGAAEAA